jgi:hypothetical protein
MPLPTEIRPSSFSDANGQSGQANTVRLRALHGMALECSESALVHIESHQQHWTNAE